MRKLYIATALLVFIAALITQLPAKLVWSWVQDDAAAQSVYLNGISGSAYNGQANSATVQGLLIKQPGWSGNYLPLLIGRTSFDISGSLDGYPLDVEASATPAGALLLGQSTGALTVARIAPLLKLPIIPLDGLISFDIQHARAAAERLEAIEGQVQLRNASWKLIKPPVPLGNLTADLRTEDQVIIADLSSDGPLEVKGEAKLNPDGSYEADIQIRGASDSDQRLKNLLKLLGKQVNGCHTIKQSGRIPG